MAGPTFYLLARKPQECVLPGTPVALTEEWEVVPFPVPTGPDCYREVLDRITGPTADPHHVVSARPPRD